MGHPLAVADPSRGAGSRARGQQVEGFPSTTSRVVLCPCTVPHPPAKRTKPSDHGETMGWIKAPLNAIAVTFPPARARLCHGCWDRQRVSPPSIHSPSQGFPRSCLEMFQTRNRSKHEAHLKRSGHALALGPSTPGQRWARQHRCAGAHGPQTEKESPRSLPGNPDPAPSFKISSQRPALPFL